MSSSQSASVICWLSSTSSNRKGKRCKLVIQTEWASKFKVRTIWSRNSTKSTKPNQQTYTGKITKSLKRWIGRPVSRKLTRSSNPTRKTGGRIWTVLCTTEICIKSFYTIRGQFKTRIRAIFQRLIQIKYNSKLQIGCKNYKLTLNELILVRRKPKREN